MDTLKFVVFALIEHYAPETPLSQPCFYSLLSFNKLNYAFPHHPLCLLHKVLVNHEINEIRMKKSEGVETIFLYLIFKGNTYFILSEDCKDFT